MITSWVRVKVKLKIILRKSGYTSITQKKGMVRPELRPTPPFQPYPQAEIR